jgi:uncharacterized protein YraI
VVRFRLNDSQPNKQELVHSGSNIMRMLNHRNWLDYHIGRDAHWHWRLSGVVIALMLALVFVAGPAGQARADGLCVVNVSNYDQLNVRRGPGTSHPVTATLAPGRCGIVNTGQCSGRWCLISWNNGSGWVNTRFLGFGGGDDGIGGGNPGDRLGNATYCVQVAEWDTLNVRSGPSARNGVVGVLRPWTCNVRGTGQCSGNWCQISSGGLVGWVNTRYLVRK